MCYSYIGMSTSLLITCFTSTWCECARRRGVAVVKDAGSKRGLRSVWRVPLWRLGSDRRGLEGGSPCFGSACRTRSLGAYSTEIAIWAVGR